jgi:hypothetical protein
MAKMPPKLRDQFLQAPGQAGIEEKITGQFMCQPSCVLQVRKVGYQRGRVGRYQAFRFALSKINEPMYIEKLHPANSVHSFAYGTECKT